MGVAFANAIMVGGNRLDCYNCDNLGPAYCRRGFMPICRIDFDPEYAPEDMTRLYGDQCKEIVFFMYCGDPVYTYWQKMHDGVYIRYEQYEEIPHIRDIQRLIGLEENGSDYVFAGKFRDMIWGLWNARLKAKFMFRSDKLMKYICDDISTMTEYLGIL